MLLPVPFGPLASSIVHPIATGSPITSRPSIVDIKLCQGFVEITAFGHPGKEAFFKLPLQPWRFTGVSGLLVVDLATCSVGVMQEHLVVGPQWFPAFTVPLATSSSVPESLDISFDDAAKLIVNPSLLLEEAGSGQSAACAVGSPTPLPCPVSLCSGLSAACDGGSPTSLPSLDLIPVFSALVLASGADLVGLVPVGTGGSARLVPSLVFPARQSAASGFGSPSPLPCLAPLPPDAFGGGACYFVDVGIVSPWASFCSTRAGWFGCNFGSLSCR